MQSLTADVVVIAPVWVGGTTALELARRGLTCLCSSTSRTLRPSQRGSVSRGSTAERMPWASIVATAVRPLWALQRLSQQAWCKSDAETCAIDPARGPVMLDC